MSLIPQSTAPIHRQCAQHDRAGGWKCYAISLKRSINMATIQGKSAVRTSIIGKAPKRENGGDGTERILEIVRDGSSFYLHLHSPNNLENGWAITVPSDALLAAVKE